MSWSEGKGCIQPNILNFLCEKNNNLYFVSKWIFTEGTRHECVFLYSTPFAHDKIEKYMQLITFIDWSSQSWQFLLSHLQVSRTWCYVFKMFMEGEFSTQLANTMKIIGKILFSLFSHPSIKFLILVHALSVSKYWRHHLGTNLTKEVGGRNQNMITPPRLK